MYGVHDKCYVKTIVLRVECRPWTKCPFGGRIAPAKRAMRLLFKFYKNVYILKNFSTQTLNAGYFNKV